MKNLKIDSMMKRCLTTDVTGAHLFHEEQMCSWRVAPQAILADCDILFLAKFIFS